MADRSPTASTCQEPCRAICCRYIVKRISPPRTRLDWDELYWFLCHEKVAIYIEERKWYLLVNVPCVHLTRTSRCRVYPVRPDVCRLHDPENCEYTGELDFQEYLETPEDLMRLMEKRKVSYRLPWLARENGGGRASSRLGPSSAKGARRRPGSAFAQASTRQRRQA